MQSADSDQKFPDKAFSNKAFSEDEKFELLSAYLDGELTDAEYQLVIGWIASDRKIAHHYQQQLKLRQALQSLGPAFLNSARASKHLSSEHTSSSKHTLEEDAQQNQFSRNAYAPHNLTKSQLPRQQGQRENQLNIALCDFAAAETDWRQSLLVLAMLGATAVTISAGTLTNRRRPVNLNWFKESLSGQTPQGSQATNSGFLHQHIS